MSTGKIFFLLACVLLCLGLTKECTDDAVRELEYERQQLVDTLVYVDTVRYYKPIARDSTVIRYVTMRIPVIPDTIHCDTTAGSIPAASDSALVTFPVIQRHYTDSTFEAWVSGPVAPHLDSLRILSHTSYITERATKPPKRWHIGVTAGYGYGPNGFEPYIGAGITYSIISF